MSEPLNGQHRKYWFPAKRVGWGWGPPITWQGWVVLILWVAIIAAVSPWLVLRGWLPFSLFMVGMVISIVAIGYVKGEPSRWRWG